VVSELLGRVVALVNAGDFMVSAHGDDELAAEDISLRDVVAAIGHATLVAQYPEYSKGPCVLVLERDRTGSPVHVVWGIPRGHERPAVLVTAYRPACDTWDATWTRRLG
jgi:hypothetical protein